MYPPDEDLSIIKKRIAEKIEMKTHWYLMRGIQLRTNPYKEYLHAN